MEDLIEKQVGSYLIVEMLGEGGMSTVYKAFQARLERYVALKFVRPKLTSEEDFLQRFEREAKLLARLNHANIVTIFDFGELEERLYLVMEYVEGSSLKEWLAEEGRRTLQQALPIVRQVSAALEHAHSQGIIHRDVKPANVMLTPDGRALLSDFGISKLLAFEGEGTQTGDLMGTPAYMPPEQIMTEVGEIGPASDVYSLGMVVYELLTGELPIGGQTPVEAMFKRLQEPPRPAREIVPELSEAVEAVLQKALSREPSERYARRIFCRP